MTDQVLLSALLAGHYMEEPDVSEAQPLRDETDESRQASYAGWENVLHYCASELFEQQFFTNDYVIIQIDTDVCGQKNFNIQLKTGNKDRSTAQIISDVKEHIIGYITQNIYNKYKDRIIFAISIHSLECWLLPLYGKTAIEKGRKRQCEMHLINCLRRFNIIHAKDFSTYSLITEKFLEKANIEVASLSNESLDYFVKSLPAI